MVGGRCCVKPQMMVSLSCGGAAANVGLSVLFKVVRYVVELRLVVDATIHHVLMLIEP